MPMSFSLKLDVDWTYRNAVIENKPPPLMINGIITVSLTPPANPPGTRQSITVLS